MRNEKQRITNAIATIVSVIARASIISRLLVYSHGPKQSSERGGEVNKPLRLAHIMLRSRGLLRAIEIGRKHQDHVSPRNDGWALRLLFVSYFLFHISHPAFAQSPYTGGPGDGHAMGELVLRPVSVGELSATNGYTIYPSLAKPNQTVYITAPAAGEFVLVDITGRTVIHQNLAQPAKQFPVTVTQPGSYIGILRTAEGTFTQKIMVIE